MPWDNFTVSTTTTTIYTIGHSTRPIDVFLALLKVYGVEMLVDVRTVPGSRHNPQYNAEALRQSLEAAGIGYLHMKGLGGLRRPLKNSINVGWRNDSFRGFADYMQTIEFEANLDELIRVAKISPTAIMCSEAVPWRCHRSLIADALLVRGFEVVEIIGERSSRPHVLTPFAYVEGLRISYP